MSTLFLIRHGQASFGADDYDVLSELGARQARALGWHWANIGHKLDALYTGPLRRHIATTDNFLAGANDAGASVPAPVEVAGISEFPAFELLRHFQPVLQAEDPEYRDILARVAASRDGVEKSAGMEQLFHHVVGKWVRAELATGDMESYVQFKNRVRAALASITEREGRGKTVAVITSGGPICIALQWALDLSDQVAMRQTWVLANCSVSEFRYRDPHALTLVGLNAMDHLRADGLITYR